VPARRDRMSVASRRTAQLLLTGGGLGRLDHFADRAGSSRDSGTAVAAGTARQHDPQAPLWRLSVRQQRFVNESPASHSAHPSCLPHRHAPVLRVAPCYVDLRVPRGFCELLLKRRPKKGVLANPLDLNFRLSQAALVEPGCHQPGPDRWRRRSAIPARGTSPDCTSRCASPASGVSKISPRTGSTPGDRREIGRTEDGTERGGILEP
jgi:hypothetical protein